ncbi:auxin response factor 16 [Actinidia rufa]|uniref:Auxin response factor n=1 Tax=Actinidia rufa TaxID=165716 RepID=A0A7J0HBJ2_9ERIC|nr:auxin response factor 16 [Actinidia rufa]
MREVEKSLDSQLWHACAGGMVQMPPVNSKVFYFPQGHAEHALTPTVDFGDLRRIPALILCRVAAVRFMADAETDEVYAKIRLIPIRNTDADYDDEGFLGSNGPESAEKPSSFVKTLTQSDANNGGGFSVPRYCAETIFPRLDYSADPPVQTVIVKDVHGDTWKFRHIFRGTPRRHLLTTGWSTFVNQKKLVAGDSIVFLRAENGDLCVGIRRAKRGIAGGPESHSGWNSPSGNYVSPFVAFSAFLREDENKLMRNGSSGNLNSGDGGLRGKGRVRPEDVVEAASLAANWQPFEVVYYPRASTPEFCIKASSVRASMRIQWCSGMRFKMPFETDDSRISWFMGTVASVQVADPIHWPNSPWRILQMAWDEPDLLQNVKRVSPWLVELVSNMPTIHISPFSPPRKKLRLPQHLDFSLDGQFSMPSFSGNPLGPLSPLRCLSDNIPAGIQGARHAQYGIPLSDLHFNDKLQLGLFRSSLQRIDPHVKISDGLIPSHVNRNENISCLLTMGNSNSKLEMLLEKTDNVKKPQFILFGQPILTEQQISRSRSSVAVSQVLTGKSSPDGIPEKAEKSAFDHQGFHMTELGLDTGHCKVFMESQDVGRNLDLSVIESYEELYKELTNMFGIERSETPCRVLYKDATGAIKQTGDEPFSDFMKTAKRLTIVLDSVGNNFGRKWMTGMRNAENGLDSSNQTCPLSLSTFA